ncbi:MAG: hypothetical protein ACRDWD_13975 [Acidimicrobiia bacterium]
MKWHRARPQMDFSHWVALESAMQCAEFCHRHAHSEHDEALDNAMLLDPADQSWTISSNGS